MTDEEGQTSEVNFYPRPPRGGRRACPVRADLGVDFYPRPPRGGRQLRFSVEHGAALFLSTPSARRATVPGHAGGTTDAISIHALREEGDLTNILHDVVQIQFLSTPSARRATAPRPETCVPLYNFYPRPPRGGRPTASMPPQRRSRISIHALREEGD